MPARIRKTLPQVNEAERAYLAGILDGEGCVSLYWRRKSARYLTPSVQVLNTRRELIDWLQERWGGSIYQRPNNRPNYKPSWTWTIAGQLALKAIADARPYLVLKGPQADLLLTRLPRAYPAQEREKGRWKKNADFGPAELAANLALVNEMRGLNRRGAHAA